MLKPTFLGSSLLAALRLVIKQVMAQSAQREILQGFSGDGIEVLRMLLP